MYRKHPYQKSMEEVLAFKKITIKKINHEKSISSLQGKSKQGC